jgi:protein O-mannose beta-1,4-N-acetylglucosaminyltransferase
LGINQECTLFSDKQNEKIRRLAQMGVGSVPGGLGDSVSIKNSSKIVDIPPNSMVSEEPPIEADVTTMKHFDILPESSVWCTGNTYNDRKCRFRNLCYSSEREEWFILKTNRTIQKGVPHEERYKNPLLETSSIDNHPYFHWNFVEVSPFLPEFRNINIRYEELTHFMFKRLHPHNIMHNLHDDVLNLYFLIKEYVGKATEPGRMVLPFSLFAHRIIMLDQYEGTDSTRPFQYLSNHPIRFSSYLNRNDNPSHITCFRDAIIGNTNVTKWLS